MSGPVGYSSTYLFPPTKRGHSSSSSYGILGNNDIIIIPSSANISHRDPIYQIPHHHNLTTAERRRRDISYLNLPLTAISLSIYICNIVFDLIIIQNLYAIKRHYNSRIIKLENNSVISSNFTKDAFYHPIRNNSFPASATTVLNSAPNNQNYKSNGSTSSLPYENYDMWFWIFTFILFFSFLVSQIVSLIWYNTEFRASIMARALSRYSMIHKQNPLRRCLTGSRESKSNGKQLSQPLNEEGGAMNVGNENILKTYIYSKYYFYDLVRAHFPILLLHLFQLQMLWRYFRLFFSPFMIKMNKANYDAIYYSNTTQSVDTTVPMAQESVINNHRNDQINIHKSVLLFGRLEYSRISILKLLQGILQGIPFSIIKSYLLVLHYTTSPSSTSPPPYAILNNHDYEATNNDPWKRTWSAGSEDMSDPLLNPPWWAVYAGILSPHQTQQLNHKNPKNGIHSAVLQLRDISDPDLMLVSAFFSLICLAWSLSTFRKKYLSTTQPSILTTTKHMFALSWTDITIEFISQLLLFCARVLLFVFLSLVCLTWTMVILGLHWIIATIWYIKNPIYPSLPDKSTPKPLGITNGHLTHQNDDGRSSNLKYQNKWKQELGVILCKILQFCPPWLTYFSKVFQALVLAFANVFTFIDFHGGNPKFRLTTYYIMTTVENTLALTIWLYRSSSVVPNTVRRHDLESFKYQIGAILSSYVAYFIGLGILILHYRIRGRRMRGKQISTIKPQIPILSNNFINVEDAQNSGLKGSVSTHLTTNSNLWKVHSSHRNNGLLPPPRSSRKDNFYHSRRPKHNSASANNENRRATNDLNPIPEITNLIYSDPVVARRNQACYDHHLPLKSLSSSISQKYCAHKVSAKQGGNNPVYLTADQPNFKVTKMDSSTQSNSNPLSLFSNSILRRFKLMKKPPRQSKLTTSRSLNHDDIMPLTKSYKRQRPLSHETYRISTADHRYQPIQTYGKINSNIPHASSLAYKHYNMANNKYNNNSANKHCEQRRDIYKTPKLIANNNDMNIVVNNHQSTNLLNNSFTYNPQQLIKPPDAYNRDGPIILNRSNGYVTGYQHLPQYYPHHNRSRKMEI